MELVRGESGAISSMFLLGLADGVCSPRRGWVVLVRTIHVLIINIQVIVVMIVVGMVVTPFGSLVVVVVVIIIISNETL